MIDNTALIALDLFITEHTKVIRNSKVSTDLDLADLFLIDIKLLRRKVKSNLKCFPNDFMLVLSSVENIQHKKVR
jgi:hypothetical protein